MILSTHCTESTSRSHTATVHTDALKTLPAVTLLSVYYSPQTHTVCSTDQLTNARFLLRDLDIHGYAIRGRLSNEDPPKSLLGCTPVPSASPQVLLYSPVPPASCSSKAIMAKHRQAHTSPHALGIVTPARMHSVSSHPVTLDLWASSRELTSQPRDESSPVPVESSPPSLEMKVVLYRWRVHLPASRRK